MQVGVNVRPYAKECLKECAAIGYQVVIFTASHQTYADAILDTFIDPKRIYPRLYRQHCTKALGFQIKDLKVLRQPLNNVLIVDNSVISFAF